MDEEQENGFDAQAKPSKSILKKKNAPPQRKPIKLFFPEEIKQQQESKVSEISIPTINDQTDKNLTNETIPTRIVDDIQQNVTNYFNLSVNSMISEFIYELNKMLNQVDPSNISIDHYVSEMIFHIKKEINFEKCLPEVPPVRVSFDLKLPYKRNIINYSYQELKNEVGIKAKIISEDFKQQRIAAKAVIKERNKVLNDLVNHNKVVKEKKKKLKELQLEIDSFTDICTAKRKTNEKLRDNLETLKTEVEDIDMLHDSYVLQDIKSRLQEMIRNHRRNKSQKSAMQCCTYLRQMKDDVGEIRSSRTRMNLLISNMLDTYPFIISNTTIASSIEELSQKSIIPSYSSYIPLSIPLS